MAEHGFCGAFDFRDDALSQGFAKLNAPLVERINSPDRALCEDAVLVKSNKLAERFWSELVYKDRIRWAVPFEHLVRDEPIRSAFGLDLLGRLAERQRFGLRENICQKHVVVAANWIERLAECNEVAGDEPGPLMDQLVEGVLAVGSRLAPIDWAGLV